MQESFAGLNQYLAMTIKFLAQRQSTSLPVVVKPRSLGHESIILATVLRF